MGTNILFHLLLYKRDAETNILEHMSHMICVLSQPMTDIVVSVWISVTLVNEN